MPGWLGALRRKRAILLHVFDLAVEEEAEKVEYYRETAIPVPRARIEEAIYACEDFLCGACHGGLWCPLRVRCRSPAEYRDLTPERAPRLFHWRAALRREVSAHCDAFVYLYLSELMLGVGAANAAEALDCMDAFASSYFSRATGARLCSNFKIGALSTQC